MVMWSGKEVVPSIGIEIDSEKLVINRTSP